MVLQTKKKQQPPRTKHWLIPVIVIATIIGVVLALIPAWTYVQNIREINTNQQQWDIHQAITTVTINQCDVQSRDYEAEFDVEHQSIRCSTPGTAQPVADAFDLAQQCINTIFCDVVYDIENNYPISIMYRNGSHQNYIIEPVTDSQ